MVAEATCLVARESGAALDGCVGFPGEFFIMAGAFALGQFLNFGSLAYVVDCNGEHHLLNEAALASNDPWCCPFW